jgi:hypothetical protein
MPEYHFKPTSYRPQQQVTLSRESILDLYAAAEKFPEVEHYDVTVTDQGIKATFTLDFTKPQPLSEDHAEPTAQQVLEQLANLRANPPPKLPKQQPLKEDTQNATHNQDTIGSVTTSTQ